MATLIENFLGGLKNSENAAYIEAVSEIYNTLFEADGDTAVSAKPSVKSLADREAEAMSRYNELSSALKNLINPIINAGLEFDKVTGKSLPEFDKDIESVNVRLSDLQAMANKDLAANAPTPTNLDARSGALYTLAVGVNAMNGDLMRQSLNWLYNHVSKNKSTAADQEAFANAKVQQVIAQPRLRAWASSPDQKEKIKNAALEYIRALATNVPLVMHQYLTRYTADSERNARAIANIHQALYGSEVKPFATNADKAAEYQNLANDYAQKAEECKEQLTAAEQKLAAGDAAAEGEIASIQNEINEYTNLAAVNQKLADKFSGKMTPDKVANYQADALTDTDTKKTPKVKTDDGETDSVFSVKVDELKNERLVMEDLFNSSAEGQDLTIQVPINFVRATKAANIDVALMANTYKSMKARVLRKILAAAKNNTALRGLLDPVGVKAAADRVFETTILDPAKFTINEVKISGIDEFDQPDVNSGIITFKYNKNAASIKSLLQIIVDALSLDKPILCNIKLGDIADASEAGVQDLNSDANEQAVYQEKLGTVVDSDLDVNKDDNIIGVSAVCASPSAANKLADFAKTLPHLYLENVRGVRRYARDFKVGITALSSDPSVHNVVSLIFTGDLSTASPSESTILKVAVAGMESAMENFDEGDVVTTQHSSNVGHSLVHDQGDGQQVALRTLLQAHRSSDHTVNRNMFYNPEYGDNIIGNGDEYIPYSKNTLESKLVKGEDDKLGKTLVAAIERFLKTHTLQKANAALNCDQTDSNSFSQFVTRIADKIMRYKRANKLESINDLLSSLFEAEEATGLNPFAALADDDDDEVESTEPAVSEETPAPVEDNDQVAAEPTAIDTVAEVDPAAEQEIIITSDEIATRLIESGIIDYLRNQATRGSAKTDDDFSTVSRTYGDAIKNIINSTPTERLLIAINASERDNPMYANMSIPSFLADNIVEPMSDLSREERKAKAAEIRNELEQHRDELIKSVKDAVANGEAHDKLLGSAQSYMQQLASLYSNRKRTVKALKDASQYHRKENDDELGFNTSVKPDAVRDQAIAAAKANAETRKINPMGRMKFGSSRMSRTNTRR